MNTIPTRTQRCDMLKTFSEKNVPFNIREEISNLFNELPETKKEQFAMIVTKNLKQLQEAKILMTTLKQEISKILKQTQ